MSSQDETHWTLIHKAAAGDEKARATFARRYLPCVRAYLAARWRGSPYAGEVEDAVQDVFLACFRSSGALERLEPDRTSSFRAFLFGVARNAALHVETRRAREHARRGNDSFHPEVVAGKDESLSRVFDRQWAQGILSEAIELQIGRASERGPAAQRRVELLRIRFQEGLPIRDIAARWNEDAARLHTEYAQARKEFLLALCEILGVSASGSLENIKAECKQLLSLLDRSA